jgi:hypothetical protein
MPSRRRHVPAGSVCTAGEARLPSARPERSAPMRAEPGSAGHGRVMSRLEFGLVGQSRRFWALLPSSLCSLGFRGLRPDGWAVTAAWSVTWLQVGSAGRSSSDGSAGCGRSAVSASPRIRTRCWPDLNSFERRTEKRSFTARGGRRDRELWGLRYFSLGSAASHHWPAWSGDRLFRCGSCVGSMQAGPRSAACRSTPLRAGVPPLWD